MTNYKHEDKKTDEATLIYGTLKKLDYSGDSFDSYLIFNNNCQGATIEYEDQGGYLKIEITPSIYSMLMKYEEGQRHITISETCYNFEELLKICNDYVHPDFESTCKEVKEFFKY